MSYSDFLNKLSQPKKTLFYLYDEVLPKRFETMTEEPIVT